MAYLTFENDDVTSEVFWGDCRAVQDAGYIEPESVQLIMTSPPYAGRREKQYGGISESMYVKWFLQRSRGFYKILKPGGSFVLNIQENVVDYQLSLYVYKLVIALVEQGWYWIDDFQWFRNTTPGKWTRRFRNNHEHCYHFTKGPEFKMNQEAVMVPLSEATIKAAENAKDERRESGTGAPFGVNMANFKGRTMGYPSNVLNIPAESVNHSHAAVFPTALPMWFIKLFTDEHDLVYDPFLGSGTTLVAANALRRNGVGCEYLAKHLKPIRKRLTGIVPGDTGDIEQREIEKPIEDVLL